MTINLSDYEAGAKYKGDYDDDLAKLQERLAHIQVAHIVHKRRALILLEGWDAAGKGGIIKRMTADWDPRYASVWPISLRVWGLGPQLSRGTRILAGNTLSSWAADLPAGAHARERVMDASRRRAAPTGRREPGRDAVAGRRRCPRERRGARRAPSGRRAPADGTR